MLASIRLLWFIKGGSDAAFSLNLSKFFWVNDLLYGLSFIDCVLISIREKFDRWSEMSVIKLPDEHLF